MSLATILKGARPRPQPSGPADVADGTTTNPYLNARRTWNAHTGSVVSSRQMWQIAGLLCLLITLSAVGGIIYIGAQSKFVPFMVPVDKLAQVGAPVALDPAAPTDPRVIRATVASFIDDARMVTPDIALQRKAVFRLYAHMAASDPATARMTEWLNGTPESSPFKRAESESVSTEIVSVLAQSPDTWQVDWTETVRDRTTGGVKSGPTRMRALVTVYVVPPSSQVTEEQMRDNPLRIFVRDFNWSRQL
jgi:type IV secretory pathway TrbF-like protein